MLFLCCHGTLNPPSELLKIEDEACVCVFVDAMEPQIPDEFICENPVLIRLPCQFIFCTGG
jgi:hypothetical protein